MAQPIVCEYFIQNDECDSNLKHNPYPNIFILPKKHNSIADVRVKEVLDAFPLAYADTQHKYVLRFETVLQISQTKRINAWMDLENQLDIAVPHVKGRIRIKALRLPLNVTQKLIPPQPRHFKQENTVHSNRSSNIGMQQKPQLHQQNQHYSLHQSQQNVRQEQKGSFPDLTSVFGKVGGLFYGKDEQKEQQESIRQTNFHEQNNQFQQKQYQTSQQIPANQEFTNLFGNNEKTQDNNEEAAWDKFNYEQAQDTNLLFTDGEHDNNFTQPVSEQKNENSQNVNTGFDLFEDEPTSSTAFYQPPKMSSSNDLFDLDFNSQPQPSYAPPEMNPTQGKGGENSIPLSRINQVQQIFTQQQEQKDNWDKAYVRHEDKITNWVGRPPMKNHVRVLLCTLDQVLWPGNGWERVGMDKLLDPQKVKLYYRKATMLCHPDKLGNSETNPDKVYIANRCFAAITEAYNLFKKEEGIQ